MANLLTPMSRRAQSSFNRFAQQDAKQTPKQPSEPAPAKDGIKLVEDYEAEGLSPPSNILEDAVMTGRLDLALDLLRSKLGITPDRNTVDLLDGREFMRGAPVRRYEMLANYIRAECFAALERGARMVPMPDALERTLRQTKD